MWKKDILIFSDSSSASHDPEASRNLPYS